MATSHHQPAIETSKKIEQSNPVARFTPEGSHLEKKNTDPDSSWTPCTGGDTLCRATWKKSWMQRWKWQNWWAIPPNIKYLATKPICSWLRGPLEPYLIYRGCPIQSKRFEYLEVQFQFSVDMSAIVIGRPYPNFWAWNSYGYRPVCNLHCQTGVLGREKRGPWQGPGLETPVCPKRHVPKTAMALYL